MMRLFRRKPRRDREAEAAQRKAEADAAAAAQISSAPRDAQHTIAGIPLDAEGFLSFLVAGEFTSEQLAYLRSGALADYEDASERAGWPPLSVPIVVAWRRVVDDATSPI